MFAEVAKNAKKMPGPASYKPDLSIDKFVLKRTPKICKSSLEKVSITASEQFVKKEIPGPPKYKLNYRLIENRTPFLTNLAKSVGRDNKSKTEKDNIFRIKKDKTAGPGTYKIESGV